MSDDEQPPMPPIPPPGSVPPPPSAQGPMPPPPGGGGPALRPESGGGWVAGVAAGVCFGLAVVQVFASITFVYNTSLETGQLLPNVSPINRIVLNVVLFSPSLIALGLVAWMIVAMVRAKRHAPAEDPTAGATPSAVPSPGIAATPAMQRKRRTITGVLIGAATFLLTCAGPCVGPALTA